MAHSSTVPMALASPSKSLAIPNARSAGDFSGTANYEKAASALLTPPALTSPEVSAHPASNDAMSPPPIPMEHEMEAENVALQGGMPLSKGALSDLDGSVTITPSMLAKHHLPGIMLGNGPRPIRDVMAELTYTVPGFSRIPPAKARRIVVAALESRDGGGPDGNVAFCKTGWGRWDCHIKGSSRDSGIGSFIEGRLSPPRSEHSSYAVSHNDSAVHGLPTGKHREHYSGGSWTASSIREQDERMDMDPIEEAADKMSLDGQSDDSSSTDDETDDDDWAAVGVEALRKATMPKPGAPRQNYRAVSIPYNGRWASKSYNQQRSSTTNQPSHSASVPTNNDLAKVMQTPEEKEAVAALMSLGSSSM